MSFLGRVFRFLFWVLILSWVVKLLGRAISGSAGPEPTGNASGAAEHEPAMAGKRLVKDPVCGMHMAEELALPFRADGETHYFCSQECRAKYASSILHRAANA
jgi:YHS domain-containing protein